MGDPEKEAEGQEAEQVPAQDTGQQQPPTEPEGDELEPNGEEDDGEGEEDTEERDSEDPDKVASGTEDSALVDPFPEDDQD